MEMQQSDDVLLKRQKQKRRNWQFASLLWFLFLLGVLSLFFLFLFTSKGMLGELPSVEQLENPELALATEVISVDSVVIGKYFSRNRSNAEYRELSPYLVNALISTEDYRFYSHTGIDFKGLARAIFYLGKRGGASTITQQLAKNLFTNVDRSSTIKRIIQKLKEWVIAIELERRYTKNEIITMYFNTMGLSDNTYGIKSAASTYFNKLPIDLNIQESATLIGMLKAPTSYNPRKHPEASQNRRNIVINQMVNFGDLPEAEADSISKITLKLDYTSIDHNIGPAPYFREYLRVWVNDWCKNNKKIDGTNYDIYRDGLKIFTTLDSKLQRYAERALVEHLPSRQKLFNKYFKDKKRHPWAKEPGYIESAIKKSERYSNLKREGKSHKEILEIFDEKVETRIFSWEGSIDTLISPKDSVIYNKYILHAGFMAMEPGSGEIKAWVGGIDHRYYKYDNVKPSAKRQVGSTFKPFIYSLAVQNGWSPCQKVPNMPVTFDKYKNYTPENASSYREGEMITLKEGLAYSMNQITAYLMKEMNPLQTEDGYVAMTDFFKQMGIQSYILPVPSMCLGVADISVFEMVGAYGTFANKGVWVEPNFIKRIEDKNGNIIQEFQPEQVEALDAFSNYGMIELLRNVVDIGTARRLRKEPYEFNNDIIGKTGTTQDNADGWFMGITPNLVCGTWIGGDDKVITIKNTDIWSGASLGIPVFGEFMKFIYEDDSLEIKVTDAFEAPPGYKSNAVCEDDLKALSPDAIVNNQNTTPVLAAGNGYNAKLIDSLNKIKLSNSVLDTLKLDSLKMFDPNQPQQPELNDIQKDNFYGDEFE